MRTKTLLLIATFAMLLDVDTKALPPEVAGFLADTKHDLTEDGFLPEKPVEVLAFARYVAGNWQSVLTAFDQLAPDTRRQKLVVVAAEFLPPLDYVAFIGGIADLKASGKVTLETIKMIATAKTFKDGFLAFNYDKPAVAAVINKLEAILEASEPGQWTDYFGNIKAGTTLQSVVAERSRDGEPMPEALDAGPSAAYRQLMGLP